jgi:hypothetical protein
MVSAYNTGSSNDPRSQNPYPIPNLPNPVPSNYQWGFKNKGYIIKLMPQASTNACGRTGFLIHGGQSATASEGCIIVNNPGHRRTIWDSGDHVLEVVDSLENEQ